MPSKKKNNFLQTFPKKVKIEGRTISVTYQGSARQHSEHLGTFILKTQEIFLNTEMMMEPIQVLDTFLHEAAHAMIAFNQVYIVGEPSPSEERIVQTMGKGYAQLMQENPQLVKWIAKYI